MKNVIIAQSGGPSSVINNTLRGIIETCKYFPDKFGTIYGGWHGIEGVLKEELLNLSDQPEQEVSLLRTTPAAGSIGTCRYKLKDKQQKDFQRILEVFKAHDVGYFFYIGGNDSQHTALKVSEMARMGGLDLIAVGVPKTIDNDVGDSEFQLIDHTPGYGSVARYWAHSIQAANEENRGSSTADPVLVLQAMGRKIGYIPAAARLADPHREMPLQIYLSESGVDAKEMADKVNDQLKKDGRCIAVVSEGFELVGVDSLEHVKDSFGHVEYGAAKIAAYQQVVNYLNEVGLKARGSARGQVPGTDQRHAMIYASTVDLEEAYKVGQKAVDIALNDGTGWMATILRIIGPIYHVRYDKVPLEKVALSERSFPDKWIAPNRIDVTDEFVSYASPLIGLDWPSIPLVNGLQRFTRFNPIFAAKKLDLYQLEAE
ncbi:MAG: diphosphate--fructose-6-phosphate 1-phosphotransferase [Porphyromonadaceae bacterium]|nr:MAG: diphosphate--fructose-6-phosphate 1-phosphotransferase [Porphyromonadaceae bacterium]